MIPCGILSYEQNIGSLLLCLSYSLILVLGFKIDSSCECFVFIGRCNKVWDVFMSAWALCALIPQVEVWRPQYVTLRPLVYPPKPVSRGFVSFACPADLQSMGRYREIPYVEICWQVTFLVCLLFYFTVTCQLVMLCIVGWNAVRPLFLWRWQQRGRQYRSVFRRVRNAVKSHY